MTPIIFLKDIIDAMRQLHPPPSDLVLPLSFYYQHEHTFVLDKTLFAQALVTTPHLSSSGFFGMVYEYILRCFIPKDPSLRFLELFKVVVAITRGDILRSVALVLGVNRLLAMVKDISGLCPIIVGEVFFRLISHSIVF